MKPVMITALIAVAALCGCESQAKRDAELKKAKDNLASSADQSFRELNNKNHELTVGIAEKLYDEQTALTLTRCYEDGFDTVQNSDHTFTNDPKLGPKYLAKCSKIVQAIKVRTDKIDKEHEKEISQ